MTTAEHHFLEDESEGRREKQDREIADLFARQRALIDHLEAVQAEMRKLGVMPTASNTWKSDMAASTTRINDRLDGKDSAPAPKPMTESAVFRAIDLRRALKNPTPNVHHGTDETVGSDEMAV